MMRTANRCTERDEMTTTTPRYPGLLALLVAGLLACGICVAGCSETPSGTTSPVAVGTGDGTPEGVLSSSTANATDLHAPGISPPPGASPHGAPPGGNPGAGLRPNGTPPDGPPPSGLHPNGTPPDGTIPGRGPPGDAGGVPPADR